MVVNYEFLDKEPMDNLITCLNFKVDKVVFLGFQEDIVRSGKSLEKFLSKYCGIKEVVFKTVPRYDLHTVFETLRGEVRREEKNGNKVYFDLTGGNNLVLAAFGMLSREMNTPMHMFNVGKDRLIELNEDRESGIKQNVEMRKVPLTLDMVIEMHGGAINYRMQKGSKEISDEEFAEDVEKIYQVGVKYWKYWNPFSDLLEKLFNPPSHALAASKGMPSVQREISKSGTKLVSVKIFNEIVEELEKAGILKEVTRSNDFYSITYKNEAIKEILWEGGAILELQTYLEESMHGDDCRVGVHLDWDGVIHKGSGVDLINEVDVLALKGNVPTFISCKSGKMNYVQTLHALYELDTVANRFGGKYCKKVLATVQPVRGVYLERAKEMKIEVRNVGMSRYPEGVEIP